MNRLTISIHKLNTNKLYVLPSYFRMDWINFNNTITITILSVFMTTIYIKRNKLKETLNRILKNKCKPNCEMDPNKLTYNSYRDPLALLLFNDNLTNITIDTIDVSMTFESCVEACFRQMNLKALSIYTNLSIKREIRNHTTLHLLRYLHLSVDATKEYNRDHLNPIIQCAKNIEVIIYENGYLNDHSMFILTKLHKLKSLVLEDIMISEYKAYSIMLFNLRVKLLISRLKHPFVRD